MYKIALLTGLLVVGLLILTVALVLITPQQSSLPQTPETTAPELILDLGYSSLYALYTALAEQITANPSSFGLPQPFEPQSLALSVPAQQLYELDILALQAADAKLWQSSLSEYLYQPLPSQWLYFVSYQGEPMLTLRVAVENDRYYLLQTDTGAGTAGQLVRGLAACREYAASAGDGQLYCFVDQDALYCAADILGEQAVLPLSELMLQHNVLAADLRLWWLDGAAFLWAYYQASHSNNGGSLQLEDLLAAQNELTELRGDAHQSRVKQWAVAGTVLAICVLAGSVWDWRRRHGNAKAHL